MASRSPGTPHRTVSGKNWLMPWVILLSLAPLNRIDASGANVSAASSIEGERWARWTVPLPCEITVRGRIQVNPSLVALKEPADNSIEGKQAAEDCAALYAYPPDAQGLTTPSLPSLLNWEDLTQRR